MSAVLVNTSNESDNAYLAKQFRKAAKENPQYPALADLVAASANDNAALVALVGNHALKEMCKVPADVTTDRTISEEDRSFWSFLLNRAVA